MNVASTVTFVVFKDDFFPSSLLDFVDGAVVAELDAGVGARGAV
jgi:hypothetical protein